MQYYLLGIIGCIALLDVASEFLQAAEQLYVEQQSLNLCLVIKPIDQVFTHLKC
jgi:hypothetical protein